MARMVRVRMSGLVRRKGAEFFDGFCGRGRFSTQLKQGVNETEMTRMGRIRIRLVGRKRAEFLDHHVGIRRFIVQTVDAEDGARGGFGGDLVIRAQIEELPAGDDRAGSGLEGLAIGKN